MAVPEGPTRGRVWGTPQLTIGPTQATTAAGPQHVSLGPCDTLSAMDAFIDLIKNLFGTAGGMIPSEGEAISTVNKFSWAIALLIVIGGGMFLIKRVGEAVNGILSSVPAKLVGAVVVVGVAILIFK